MLTLKKFNGTIPIGNPILIESASELSDFKIDTIVAAGYVLFHYYTEPPENDDVLKEYVEGEQIDLGDNTWETNWELKDKILSDDELVVQQAIATGRKWDKIRGKRSHYLLRTDWYGNSDVVMPADVATYRQALRDITEGVSDPDDVVWPDDPLNLP